MKLREYQAVAIERVISAIGAGKSTLLNAPTGSGKTRMAVEICANRGRVLWVVDRIALIDQARRAFCGQAGVIHSLYRSNPSAPVQIVTRQALMAHEGNHECDLLVYDECHHSVAEGTLELLRERVRFGALLGLTATPARSDRRSMGRLFDVQIDAAKYSELIDDGYITGCKVIAPDSYVGPNLAQPVLESWEQFGCDRQTLAFCARQIDCYEQDELFRSRGHKSAVVLADTPAGLRSKRMSQFQNGLLDIIFSVSTMTEGVDFPAASCTVLARSFATVGTYMQACGRVMRAHELKDDALVIDLVGASHIHGPPDADREWSDHEPEQTRIEQPERAEADRGEQEIVGAPLFATWLPAEERKPWKPDAISNPPATTRLSTVCSCGRKLKRGSASDKCTTCLLGEI